MRMLTSSDDIFMRTTRQVSAEIRLLSVIHFYTQHRNQTHTKIRVPTPFRVETKSVVISSPLITRYRHFNSTHM